MKKAEVKVSTFLIGLIMVSVIAVFFALFISSMAVSYNTFFDNSTLTELNQLEQLDNQTKALRDQSTDIKVQSGIVDILGGYFNDAYTAMKLSMNSFEVYDSMQNAAFKEMNLGKSGQFLRVAFGLIVVILLIIGVLLSAIVKRDL